MDKRDFPSGPVVKNMPKNAADTDSIPGPRAKIPYAVGQLNPHATLLSLYTVEPVSHNYWNLHGLEPILCN